MRVEPSGARWKVSGTTVNRVVPHCVGRVVGYRRVVVAVVLAAAQGAAAQGAAAQGAAASAMWESRGRGGAGIRHGSQANGARHRPIGG